MFSLEGLIPKLCQMAQEVGDNERALRLRSAGLQSLAFMVHSFFFSSPALVELRSLVYRHACLHSDWIFYYFILNHNHSKSTQTFV